MTKSYLSENNDIIAGQPAKSMAVASMIIGIISYVTLNPMGAVLAIIFAGSAKKQGNTTGYTTAGLVCGIVGIVLSVVVTALVISTGSLVFDKIGLNIPFM